MAKLAKPYDKYSARAIMLKFNSMAYSLDAIDVFQEAINILYGREFCITPDFNKRMTFTCQICKKDMSSESAVLDHFNSGMHQKNLNKKDIIVIESKFPAQASLYKKDSLQSKLLLSCNPPVGLQMIDEYVKGKSLPFFKCNLCASYGTSEAMLNHILGRKHTMKYIVTRCELSNSVVTTNEFVEFRRLIAQREGVNCFLIKKIQGSEYYPFKWVTKNKPVSRGTAVQKAQDVEDERRSVSPVRERSSRYSEHAESPSSSQPGTSTDSLSLFRNPSPPTRKEGETMVVKHVKTAGTQVDNLDELMEKYLLLIRAEEIRESKFSHPKDVRGALDLMFGVTNVLHELCKTNLEGIQRNTQIKLLEKILGHIKLRLMDVRYEDYY